MKRCKQVSAEYPKGEKCIKSEGLRSKLYFNKIVGIADGYNTNAYSLAELLEIIAPIAGIHFNFMIDVPWLLAQYPSHLRKAPMSLIVGESGGTNTMEIVHAVRRCGECNIKVGGARLKLPFGTHHSKISIFESDSGRIHILISTANLLKSDWEYKTQAFYHCSGAELTASTSDQNKSDFGTELVKYLDEYSSSPCWSLIEYWRDRIANIDLSHVRAKIIYSVPGTHKGNEITRYGHPRLRALLQGNHSKTDDFTFHALFSSIGSLGKAAQNWLTGQFLCSLAGGTPTDGGHLRLIYPCVEDVRKSNEGYDAGGSLPYRKSVADRQPYLLGFLHKWRSDRLGRSQAMPHVKTYAAFTKNSSKPCWLLVTSANLSKAAWGEYQCNNQQILIRSFEFGVLLADPESLEMLPYDVPLEKYDVNDQPWCVDEKYDEPDVFGKMWV